MRLLLFLLFIAVPFIELALLIKLGQEFGFWPTMALIVVTAIVGTYVLQRQGLETMRRVSRSMAAGEAPVEPVIHGFFLAIAGAFLLTPGILTDVVGLSLLVPPIRSVIARWGFNRLAKSGIFTFETYTADHSTRRQERGPFSPRKGEPGAGPVIDGEYEHVDNKTNPPNGSGT